MEAELNIQKSVRGAYRKGPTLSQHLFSTTSTTQAANRQRCLLHYRPHPPIPPPCQLAPAGRRVCSLARYCVSDAEGNHIGEDEISTINNLRRAFLKELHLGAYFGKKAKT